ncbi:MAG: hypothetical protein GC154_10250 [bacterium]|nr:hypothetical protein [bacterium]
MRIRPAIAPLIICVLFASLNAAAQVRAAVGAGGFLTRGGERLFPIGAYMLPRGMTYAQAREMGFTLLRASLDESEIAAIEDAGLSSWLPLGDLLDFSQNEEQKKDRLREAVKRVSNAQSLLFYESVDEPAWTDKHPEQARVKPGGLIRGYQFLKTLDSRPVYLNHAPRNMVDTLRAYTPACDITAADVYPIIPAGLSEMYAITPDGRHGDLPNQTPSCVGEFTDKMKRIAQPFGAVFMVLQGFAWEALRPAAEQNPSLIRYPSARETRFMAYDAVIHGAHGLMYWGLSYTPPGHDFIQNLSTTLNELRDLTPAITGERFLHEPALRYQERGSSIASGIETLCLRERRRNVLIAVNTSIDPAAARFYALPDAFTGVDALRVLNEDRAVQFNGDSFFDEFEGLAVHVYIRDFN